MSNIDVTWSTGDGELVVELFGQKLTRTEATELARTLSSVLDLRSDPAPPHAVAKFAPGVDRAKLDHFLLATSERRRDLEPRRAPDITPPTARTGVEDPKIARVEPTHEPELARPAPRVTRRDAGPSDATASTYLHERGELWWERSTHPDLEPLVRAEARAIAAELFEIAEELKRAP